MHMYSYVGAILCQANQVLPVCILLAGVEAIEVIQGLEQICF